MSDLQTFMDASLVAGALAAILLLLRRPLVRLFGAQGSYLAWLVVAVPALPVRMPQLPTVDPGGVLSSSAEAMRVVTVQMTAMAPTPSVDLGELFVTLWFAGACALFAWGLGRYLYLQQSLASAERVSEFRGYPVSLAPVPVPFTLGVLRPQIYIPSELWARSDAASRRHMLEHESVHAARRDVFWNLLAYGLLCLHWINPVAWLAYAAMRRDQELSCDACVTGEASERERADYARVLVEVMASQPATAAPAMAADIRKMEERLMMVWKHRARPLGRVAAVAALTLGVSTLALRAGAAEHVEKAYFDSKVETEHEDDGEVHVVKEVRFGELQAHAEENPKNYISQGEDGVFRYGDGSEVPADVLAELESELDRERSMLRREGEVMDVEAEVLHEQLKDEEDDTWFDDPDARDHDAIHGYLTTPPDSFELAVDMHAGGKQANPSIFVRDDSTGRIELGGFGDGAAVGISFEVKELNQGMVQVDWEYEEQSGDQWVLLSSGSDVVGLSGTVRLDFGQPGSYADLTVNRVHTESID